MGRFAAIEMISDRIPDESTILAFRHLLEKHDLGDNYVRARLPNCRRASTISSNRSLKWSKPIQLFQHRKQKAVLVHALDRISRNGLYMSVMLRGQDDIQGVGIIKVLHHHHAIAQ